MAHFLDDYEPVEKRISDFWAKYPNGRIHTVIVSLDEKQVIVRAEVFTEREDHRPVTVDHAQEKVGGSGMTANSWLEIACTSAIGRALADLDFAKKGKRPSREEMVIAKGHDTAAVPDFVEIASVTNDLEDLRKLYTQAVAAKADKPTLDYILQRSEDLKK
jgi:hypothetical protein